MNLYLLRDDVVKLDTEIRQKFGAILVGKPRSEIYEFILKEIDLEAWDTEAQGTQRLFWYVLPTFLPQIPPVYSADSRHRIVLPLRRPGIQFLVGAETPNVIYRSRFWFEDGPPEFSKWARSILRYLKEVPLR